MLALRFLSSARGGNALQALTQQPIVIRAKQKPILTTHANIITDEKMREIGTRAVLITTKFTQPNND